MKPHTLGVRLRFDRFELDEADARLTCPMRNWVFGHHTVFNALNAAWATHGAEAYFWN